MLQPFVVPPNGAPAFGAPAFGAPAFGGPAPPPIGAGAMSPAQTVRGPQAFPALPLSETQLHHSVPGGAPRDVHTRPG